MNKGKRHLYCLELIDVHSLKQDDVSHHLWKREDMGGRTYVCAHVEMATDDTNDDGHFHCFYCADFCRGF